MVYLNARFYHIALICFIYLPQRAFLLIYYPTIFWCPNNCRFNLNKPGSKNAPFSFNVKPSSHLFFVCPNIAIWGDMSDRSPHHGRMYENLMLVDKDGYDTCTVNRKKNPKLNREIMRCEDNPMKFKYTEEIFSSHRAFPSKMKYNYGKTYYFISTSDGTLGSLNNTSGGHCKTHNMKLKIYICRANESCKFEMPKCPYSNVFHDMDRPTTKPITLAPKSNATSAPTNVTSVPSKISKTTTSTLKFTETGEQMGRPTGNPVQESTADPAAGDLGARTSSQTIWGKNRKHIIIHITMALIILMLSLCLIYFVISRKIAKKCPTSEGTGVNSKLYHERPISLPPINDDSYEEPFYPPEKPEELPKTNGVGVNSKRFQQKPVSVFPMNGNFHPKSLPALADV